MAAKATRAPEIALPTLGGLNERVSPANLRNGEWAVLNGLYPNLVGSLSRVPGKVMLANPGETISSGKISQLWPTYNGQQDVLVQTEEYLLRYTLDELLGRTTTPNLVITVNPLEETMSYCLLAQIEASGVNGGSIQGVVGGSDTSALANTFYGMRLTNELQDADSICTFTASTGGTGGSASTPGTFALSAGTYRITINRPIGQLGNTAVMGLWNDTDSAFATYAGGSVPILGTPAGASAVGWVSMEGRFTITGTKTFYIKWQCNNQIGARLSAFGGSPNSATATVNGSAPTNTYCLIKILKE